MSWFWGLMTVGCLVGLVLLKIFDSRRVLIYASALAVVTLSCGLFGRTGVAIYALPIGLRNGLCFDFVLIAYILSIGLWARPLINNQTLAAERA